MLNLEDQRVTVSFMNPCIWQPWTKVFQKAFSKVMRIICLSEKKALVYHKQQQQKQVRDEKVKACQCN